MKIGLTVHVVTENHTWPAHWKISIKSKPACLGKISGNNNSRMHNCLAKTVHKFTWSHPHHWSLQEFLSAPFQMLPRPCFGLVAYTCLQKLKIQDRAVSLYWPPTEPRNGCNPTLNSSLSIASLLYFLSPTALATTVEKERPLTSFSKASKKRAFLTEKCVKRLKIIVIYNIH